MGIKRVDAKFLATRARENPQTERTYLRVSSSHAVKRSENCRRLSPSNSASLKIHRDLECRSNSDVGSIGLADGRASSSDRERWKAD